MTKFQQKSSLNFIFWKFLEHSVCILFSVTVKVSCSMDFVLYPFDCQQCYLKFSSSKMIPSFSIPEVGLIINLLFFTDGLTVDSQQFRGKINLSDQVLYSSGALNYGQAKIVQDSQYEGTKIANITHVEWLGFLNLWVCAVLKNDLCTYRMTLNQNVQITSLSPYW